MYFHEDCAGRGHNPWKQYHPCILSDLTIIFLLHLFTVSHSLGDYCPVLIIISLGCALSHVLFVFFVFFPFISELGNDTRVVRGTWRI